MITEKLPKRKHHWSNKFTQVKEDGVQARIRHRKIIEEERRGYLPSFADSSSVTNFLDQEKEQVPVPFTGSRNALCCHCTKGIDSESNKRTCHLCPAVVHVECSNKVTDRYNNITEKYRTQKLKGGDSKILWFCPLCSEEIALSILHERDRLREDRIRRLQFYSALKLQASCMRHKAQSHYLKLCNGILRLQARVS
jgi:hypothetical protein